MLRITAKTKMEPTKVISSAMSYFGPGGIGLKEVSLDEGNAVFEGGGGGIELSVSPDGEGAAVEAVSKEWDYQIKDYMRQLREWRHGKAAPKPK